MPTRSTRTTAAKAVAAAAVPAVEPSVPVADTAATGAAVRRPHATTTIQQGKTMTQNPFEKVNLNMSQGYEDFAKLQKENVDAVMKAAQVLAKATEEMGKAMMAYTQASVDLAVTTGKAMLGAKTLKEVYEVQNEYAKTSVDGFLAETTKLSELSVKAANQAFEPIQARLNETVDRFGKVKAAA